MFKDITSLGVVTKALENKTSQDGQTNYSQFSLQDVLTKERLSVRVFGKIPDAVRNHLSAVDRPVMVRGELDYWFPKDDSQNLKFYSQGRRQGEPIVNFSITCQGRDIRIVGATVDNSGQGNDGGQNQQTTQNDSVRGGNDNSYNNGNNGNNGGNGGQNNGGQQQQQQQNNTQQQNQPANSGQEDYGNW